MINDAILYNGTSESLLIESTSEDRKLALQLLQRKDAYDVIEMLGLNGEQAVSS
jgi:hypothetical protein